MSIGFSWAQIKNILHFSKFNLQVNEAIVLEPECNLLFLFINFFFALVKKECELIAGCTPPVTASHIVTVKPTNNTF